MINQMIYILFKVDNWKFFLMIMIKIANELIKLSQFMLYLQVNPSVSLNFLQDLIGVIVSDAKIFVVY